MTYLIIITSIPCRWNLGTQGFHDSIIFNIYTITCSTFMNYLQLYA